MAVAVGFGVAVLLQQDDGVHFLAVGGCLIDEVERPCLSGKEGEVVFFHRRGQDALSRPFIDKAHPDAECGG